jgi:hypothetical protein
VFWFFLLPESEPVNGAYHRGRRGALGSFFPVSVLLLCLSKSVVLFVQDWKMGKDIENIELD